MGWQDTIVGIVSPGKTLLRVESAGTVLLQPVLGSFYWGRYPHYARLSNLH